MKLSTIIVLGVHVVHGKQDFLRSTHQRQAIVVDQKVAPIRKLASGPLPRTKYANHMDTTLLEESDFTTTLLQNGIPTTKVSMTEHDVIAFVYEPKSSDNFIGCRLEGADGDADLLLRWGDIPDLENHGCGSWNELSSNEYCEIPNPGDGAFLFVLVYAFTSSSDVVLSCKERDPVLNIGVPQHFSLPAYSEMSFTYTPLSYTPVYDATVACTLLGHNNGNADLYLVWYPVFPDWGEIDTFDCQSESLCEVENPQDGSDLYVAVATKKNNNTFFDVAVICSQTPAVA